MSVYEAYFREKGGLLPKVSTERRRKSGDCVEKNEKMMLSAEVKEKI